MSNLSGKNLSNRARPKTGFTIVEMLVGIVILFFVSAMVWRLFTHSIGKGQRAEDLTQTTRDARFATNYIINDIRRSYQMIVSPNRIELECFTGRPLVNQAQVESISYHYTATERSIIRHNNTTGDRKTVAYNVEKVNFVEGDGYVGIMMEAEIQVIMATEIVDTVKTTMYSKAFSRFLANQKLYEGYFSSIDGDDSF